MNTYSSVCRRLSGARLAFSFSGLAILVALLATAPLAATTYEFALGDSANRTLRLNIPASVTTVRGLLIWGNGSNSDLRGMATDPEMVAFAESMGFAVIGMSMWDAFFPGTPSEFSAFESGLDRLATDSGHPEIRTVPWLPIGHSNGGSISYGLNALQPARSIAVAVNEARGYNDTRPSIAALATPGLLLAGGADLDIRRANIRDLFDGNRPRGALWAWAEQEGIGHVYGDSFDLIIPFVAEMYTRRYPANASPLSSAVPLQSVTESEGWLVDTISHLSGLAEIAAYADYTKDKTIAGWLPSRRIAYIFRAYASHGKPTETATLSTDHGPITYGTPVTYTIGTPSVAWSSIEFYEGDTLLRTTTPTDANPLSVSHTATVAGYSVYHALVTLADGTTRRTTPPRRVFVRAPVPQTPAVAAISGNSTPNLGESVTLTSLVTGYPAPSYQWRRNNIALVDGGRISGAATTALTIANVQAGDAGLYTLVATNSLGTTASPSIFLAPPGTGARILTEPAAHAGATGQTATFSVSAGGNPTQTYRWQRLAAGSSIWTDLIEGGSYRGVATATLTVTGTTTAMSGDQFHCVVSNSAGTATTNDVALNVTGGSALLQRPIGIVVDSAGTLRVADAARNVVRTITAAGVVSTFAGALGESGSQDGTGTAARFNQPGPIVTTGGDNFYLVDTSSSTIRRITAAGVVTTLAGSPSIRGNADGIGTAASFNTPGAIAVLSDNTLYVADTFNHTIRKVTTAGVVTTFAGTASIRGETDGVGAAARFNNPEGVAVTGSGQVYVADTGNHTIRRISSDGSVTTFAGSPGIVGSYDGTGTNTLFNQPRGLALDSAGNLYVADTGNCTIRKITPAGVVTTLAGYPGIAGWLNATGATALFNQPHSLAMSASGMLYVADTGNGEIRRITPEGVVSTLALSEASVPPTTPTTPTTPITPTTPTTPSSSGGGGGALAPWFVFLLAALFANRIRSIRSLNFTKPRP